MGLLELFGLGGAPQGGAPAGGGLLGGGADLYGDILTPAQKRAIAARRVAGFSQAIAPMLGYSLDPGKIGSPLQALNAGLGGMGEAEDAAALNALRAGQLGLQSGELQSKQAIRDKIMSILPGLLGGAPGQGSPAPAAMPAVTRPGGMTSAGGALDFAALRNFAQQAGFQGQAADIIAATALAESSGDPNAIGDRNLGGSYGVTQIHEPAHGPKAREALGNPLRAMQLGYEISKGGTDFTPWTMFKNGGYLKYMPAGGAATPAGGLLGAGGTSPAPMPQSAPAGNVAAPGAPSAGIDPRALAAAGVLSQLGGMGDVFKPLEQFYYNSPEHKAALEHATRSAGLPFVAPEAQSKAAGERSVTEPSDMRLYEHRTRQDIAKEQALDPLKRAQREHDADQTIRQQTANQYGQRGAEELFKRREGAEAAAESLRSTVEARQLLDSGIISGPFAQWKLSYDRVLGDRGLAANTEAFFASRAQEVGRIIKLFGAGTGLSNADREYAERAAAGQINLTEESLRKIIDINERGARNVLERYNKDAAQVPSGLVPYPLTVQPPSAPAQSGVTSSGVRWSIR